MLEWILLAFGRTQRRSTLSGSPMPSFPTLAALVIIVASTAVAQNPVSSPPKPSDTEVWKPVPAIITPGPTNADPPSDAVVLFDGKNLDGWVSAKDGSPAKWAVANGVLTVDKPAGDIRTKRSFT